MGETKRFGDGIQDGAKRVNMERCKMDRNDTSSPACKTLSQTSMLSPPTETITQTEAHLDVSNYLSCMTGKPQRAVRSRHIPCWAWQNDKRCIDDSPLVGRTPRR